MNTYTFLVVGSNGVKYPREGYGETHEEAYRDLEETLICEGAYEYIA